MTPSYTVYKTTNTINSRFYIGVHKTLDPHDGYLGSGVVLKEAIKRYGRSAFVKEVLFSFPTSVEAYAKEKELVNAELLKSDATYNVQEGGIPSIDWGGRRRTTALCGEAHPQFGKKRTTEQKLATSETLKRTYQKKPRDPSCWEKSAAKRRGIPSPIKGIPQKEEANAKRAAAHRALPKIKCHCGREISPSNFLRHAATH
jgi:hypothetical protein